MKRLFRILVLAVAFLAGATSATAQTVQVLMTQRTAVLPVTVTSYLDDPLRYFNVQFIVNGAPAEGIDIFFDMEFSVNTAPFYVRTRQNSIPIIPIHLNEGVNIMRSEILQSQVLNRTETNVDYSNPVGAQQLPEGTYTLCLNMYLWSERNNPNRTPINIGSCPEFIMCYSGSAPELVSPMAGAQIALNGTMVVRPARKINFFWTPVISNCSGRTTRFKYKLKVVKVLNGQNYNDAIRFNPTVFSTEVRNNNYAVFDTLRDIKIQMERGALYVAQVRAERVNNNLGDPFVIANDGYSQPMPFYWDVNDNLTSSRPGIDAPNVPGGILGGNQASGRSPRFSGYVVEEEGDEGDEFEGSEGLTIWEGGVEEVSGLETIIDEMKEQYLAGFIQDASTVASLVQSYPSERKYVPTPARRYVESNGYYTVPMTDDFEVSFMPLRHDALKNVNYAIELYDYVAGGVDSITAYEPLFREEIGELPENYTKMDSHELINRTLQGWGSELQQGSLYYLQLESNFTAGYWDYVVADTNFYVNEMLAENVHDTISREFTEQELTYANGVMFQWGDDPEYPDFTTPQWKTPVDRSGDDIYDPAVCKLPATLPEVMKATSFPISWTPVKNVTEGDQVTYEVNVYELKPDQTIEEAVSDNTVLASRTLTDVTEIDQNDTKFFKVFSANKTYVLTLSTSVDGESDTYYHFDNGNEALPMVFKIVK